MRIIITKDYEELSVRAARVMLETVKGNPYAVFDIGVGGVDVQAIEQVPVHEIGVALRV